MPIISAKALIKFNEGLKLVAYDDSTGEPVPLGHVPLGRMTIGYGHTGPDVTPGLAITEEEADDLFRGDFDRAQMGAVSALWPGVWVTLRPARQGVFVDMCFELGPLGLRRFKNLLTCARDGDWAGAAKEIVNSAYYREVPKRAARNRDILLTGDWPS